MKSMVIQMARTSSPHKMANIQKIQESSIKVPKIEGTIGRRRKVAVHHPSRRHGNSQAIVPKPFSPVLPCPSLRVRGASSWGHAELWGSSVP
jgi:hypothetical protein